MKYENRRGTPGSSISGRLSATEFEPDAIPFEVSSSVAQPHYAHRGGHGIRSAGLQATIPGQPLARSGRPTRSARNGYGRRVVGPIRWWPTARAQGIAGQDHLAHYRKREPPPIGQWPGGAHGPAGLGARIARRLELEP